MGEAMNKSTTCKRTFFVSYYLLALVSFAIVLVSTVYYFYLREDVESLIALSDWSKIIKTDTFYVIVVAMVPYLVLIIALYWCSEQYFGVLSIKDDCIVLYRPLKRRKKIAFEDIQSIGIDVGTTGAFWIYISNRQIPAKYHNKINKLTPKKSDILFAYSDRAFDSLCTYLPKPYSKRFSATASIIRLYDKS